ncbi:MAG: 3-dehydro-L-gulonate 2-dehydrogenase [Chitinophagales bacterium]
MKLSFDELKETFEKILLKLSFSKDKAERCAEIFASNSRDGVYSHGLNRFPVFVDYVKQKLIDPEAEPLLQERIGMVEVWNGRRGIGIYNARLCMERAIKLAKENGMGCVFIHNSNHWMRGGTYGQMAAEAGCIGICFTNAMASMPPWGGVSARLGNNPLVIAVPNPSGPIVLDMAMSQFSYGKMQEYELANKELPVFGGFDESGAMTKDPALIRKNKSALPIGFWKGSGLALLLDIMLTVLTGGLSSAAITASGKEVGLSQCFICIYSDHFHHDLVKEIISYTKSAGQSGEVLYPGERMLATRAKNMKDGIPVDDKIWEMIQKL